MEDMNCNMASMSDSNSHLLSDITDPYGLHQLINEPTRVTDTTSTLIDLIYTNYPEKVASSGVCHVSISDHSLIFAYRKLSIGVASKRHNTIKYWSFKNFSRDYFRSDIASENWDASDNFKKKNYMWREWKIKFLNVVDTHASLWTKRVRLRAPLSNFHLRPCKIKKSKIAKLCHNKVLPKPFLEKYVLVCFHNYFTWTATFSVWGLVSEWKRLQNVACLNRYFWNNEWGTWKSKQHGTTRVIPSPFSAANGTLYQNWNFWPNFKT